MTTSFPSVTVCCFGEILWDVLPDGPQPGGAPLNVTYHLAKLGVPAALVSRIGHDPEGKRLEDLMGRWGLRKDLLQTDPVHDTSRVLARINSDNEVSYEIVFPVAWDFIEANHPTIAAVEAADYFVYGSLAARHVVSKDTLFRLLDHAACKVFDINLRPPFYQKDVLEVLLSRADILKVNHAELETIVPMFGSKPGTEEEQVKLLKERFGIKEIVVTKGSRGASYYAPAGTYHSDGAVVKVCDTIGSGDSFLAAFISAHFQKETPDVILKKATGMGAFIAGKKGGCPDYQVSEYLNFCKQL
jgi:fructokinase